MPGRSSEDPEEDVLDGDLLDAIVQLSFVTMGVLSRIGADNEMSLTQFRVLAILRDRTLRMSELSGYLGLDRSSMSGLVDRAEERGLLARTKNPDDGRVVDVGLTPMGSRLAERLSRDVASALSSALTPLGDAERRRLTSLVRRLLQSGDVGP